MKDNATFDLPGFEAPAADAAGILEPKRPANRARRTGPKQEQLTLLDLDGTDVTGLPVWQRDPNLDVTGLPVWQPSN